MSKICYVDKRFARKSLDVIENANKIITEYQAQGYTLTLRQLYYQFVSRDLLPNEQKEYKKLGSTLNNARLAGLVDWNSIEDRTRNLKAVGYYPLQSPEDVLRSAAEYHEINRWEDQENYVEVWIEKDALVGVIEGVCNEWGVPYFACRGYNSQSEQWKAGMRFVEKIKEGKQVHILHLGDHDPSGMDMTVDNDQRLETFALAHVNRTVNVHRLALNMDQVKQYSPPPNPAKQTDSRFSKYVSEFGNSCWELDALEPKVISGLIEDNIKDLIDDDLWEASGDREEEEKQSFYDAVDELKGI